MSASLRWRNGPPLFFTLIVTARSSRHQGHVPLSHTNANPCCWDKGILASQQAWGTLFLYRSAPKLSALCTRINVIQQKLQEKVKYQQQNVSCVPVSPHCVSAWWQETVRKTEQARGWREKNWRSAELESWKGAKFQIRKDPSNLLCRNIECHLRKGSRLPPQRASWRSSIP